MEDGRWREEREKKKKKKKKKRRKGNEGSWRGSGKWGRIKWTINGEHRVGSSTVWENSSEDDTELCRRCREDRRSWKKMKKRRREERAIKEQRRNT